MLPVHRRVAAWWSCVLNCTGMQDTAPAGPFPNVTLRHRAAAHTAREAARDSSAVFDAYSQGFHFPRCEDVLGIVRRQRPQDDGPPAVAAAAPDLPSLLAPRRRHMPASTAPGEIGSGSMLRHRRWFAGEGQDVSELCLPGLRSSLSAAGVAEPWGSGGGAVRGDRGNAAEDAVAEWMAAGGDTASTSTEGPGGFGADDMRWERRLESVRQRLQHVRRSFRAQEVEGGRRDARRPGEAELGTPARVAVLGSAADEDTATQGGAARSVGRRPRGPGDAFQGMSLDQVLRSGHTREEAEPVEEEEGGAAAAAGGSRDGGAGGDEEQRDAVQVVGREPADGGLDAFGGLSLGQLLPPRRGPRAEGAGGEPASRRDARGEHGAGGETPLRPAVRYGRRRAAEPAEGRRAGVGGSFWVDVAEATVPEPPPLARSRRGTIVRGGQRQVLGAGPRHQAGVPQRAPELPRLMQTRGRGGPRGSRDGTGAGGAEALRLLERFAFSPMAFKEMAGRVGPARQGSVSSDDFECAVCLGAFTSDQVLRRYGGCGHCFHERCITAWLVRGDARCPMCRWCPFKQSW